MVIGVKERKDKEVKFSDKIRRNFERFKDKVEGLGKKAIILGGVGIGVGLGCASDGVSPKQYTLDQVQSGRITIDEFVENMDLYSLCYTKEDSIAMVAIFWWKTTGSKDPLIWEKLIRGENVDYERTYPPSGPPPFNVSRDDLYGLRVATSPYVDTLIQRAKDGAPLIK